MATATKKKASKPIKKQTSSNRQGTKKESKEIVIKKDKVAEEKSVTETVKKAVKKKVDVDVKKEDLEPFTFEQMLDKSFGKKGTEERDKAEILINEGVEKLISDIKNKLKQEKERISEVNTLLPKGILPADYVPEIKSEEEKPNRPIELFKEFIVHSGAEFLNGDLKVQENNTRVSRTKDTEYVVYGNIGSPTAFSFPFKCVDLAEAEKFLDELIDYQTKQKEMENTPKTEAPIQEPNKLEIISEEQKKEIINKFEGLPLNEVDIKELIKAAGDAPISNPISNQVAQNNFSNAQTLSQMESYSDTIAGLINQKPWMKMSTTEVNRVLSNQCSKLYSYLLKNDGKGYYIELSQGSVKCRCPRDTNSFLNIA